MTPKHSNLGPSAAERWINCPGSVAAIAAADTKDTPSVHAAEGTVAHELCEAFVTGKLSLKQLMAKGGRVTEQDGFEIEVTEEMVDAVIEFRDVIEADTKALLAEGKPAAVVGKAEVRVYAKSIDEALYGTADYILFQKGNRMKVYDFKYGKGVVVDPAENKQMAIYALAAMDTEAGYAFNEIELVIVQPRAGGESVRRWMMPQDWSAQFHESLKTAVEATRQDDAPVVAGKHCRWCVAKSTCKAAYDEVQKQAMVDFTEEPKTLAKGTLPDISTLSIEVLVRALDHEDYINSWFEAARLKIRGMLEAGLEVPGLKLVEGKSNRKYIDEAAVVAEFEPLFGESAIYEKKLLSPAKLEKIVGKGKLDHLTFKPEGAKSIAKESDARPAAKNAAALDFAPVQVKGDDLLAELESVPAVKQLWP